MDSPMQAEQPEQWANLRAVAEGGTINGAYRKRPFAALDDFRADLIALLEAQRAFTERTADLVADNAKLREALTVAAGRLGWASRAKPGAASTDGRKLLAQWANEANQALAQQDKPDAK